MQWHQLDHMQTICTSIETDNHTNTSSLNFLQTGCSSWRQTNTVKALKAPLETNQSGKNAAIRYVYLFLSVLLPNRNYFCRCKQNKRPSCHRATTRCQVWWNFTKYCIVLWEITHEKASSKGILWKLLKVNFLTTRLFIDKHTHTRLTALSPGPRRWAGTRKAKPIWILLKQETVSGSGISWNICKSAPRSRQTTTPTPHHSVFYRLDALPAAQPTV